MLHLRLSFQLSSTALLQHSGLFVQYDGVRAGALVRGLAPQRRSPDPPINSTRHTIVVERT